MPFFPLPHIVRRLFCVKCSLPPKIKFDDFYWTFYAQKRGLGNLVRFFTVIFFFLFEEGVGLGALQESTDSSFLLIYTVENVIYGQWFHSLGYLRHRQKCEGLSHFSFISETTQVGSGCHAYSQTQTSQTAIWYERLNTRLISISTHILLFLILLSVSLFSQAVWTSSTQTLGF